MSREDLQGFRPPDLNALAGLTVPRLIDRRAAQMPFRVALSARSVAGFRDRLSYVQLALYMRRVGAGLRQLGVQAGDRVAVFLDNDAGREAVLTALGCMTIGAVVVPVNNRGSDEELCHALALVRPVLIVACARSAGRLQAVHAVRVAIVDAVDAGPTMEQIFRWPEPCAFPSVVEPLFDVRDTDPACLLYTSGTTARSKAVIHTHRSMLHAGLAMGASVGLGASDLYQGAFPFFTSSCLNLGCLSSWVHGAGFVMEHLLDTPGRLRLVESECCTVYHGVPSVIRFMLDDAEAGRYDLGRVRRIAYGGASMPAATIDRIARRWPWMEQVHVWGMTESGPAGAYLAPHLLPRKAGRIGHAMPYCELRVVDSAGDPVAPGEPGELCFRGPSMATGYFDDPAATAEAFRDGWLHSGDLVVADEDGALLFVDRSKDIINRGGLKISSAAVEAVLYRMAGVAEAAVVAVPHDALGEDVAACVVAAPGVSLDTESMREWCSQFLADYEVPRRWVFVDALPKNPMGKLLKRKLRRMLSASAVR